MSSQPHRHDQPCRNVGLSFEQLQALAGKWSGYPPQTVTSPQCPACGTPLAPLTAFCNRECMLTAQRRTFRDGARRREPDEIAGYSFPIPRKGE